VGVVAWRIRAEEQPRAVHRESPHDGIYEPQLVDEQLRRNVRKILAKPTGFIRAIPGGLRCSKGPAQPARNS
jgi:hypothetical protein